MLAWILAASAAVITLVILALIIKDRKFAAEAKQESPSTVQFVDYNVYAMPQREKFINIALAAAAAFAVGYVFYRSIIISLLITPFALLYPKYRTKEIVRKRKQELNLQFKEALYSLSSSLSAGKAVETAFEDALKDLSIQYSDPNTSIIKEFEYITRRLEMNDTVEEALQGFANRAHVEDISNFVNVFKTCKRSGGNLVQVIKNSTEIIRDKIEIKQEIDTMLSERRFEQKVLNIIPIAMVMLVSISAKDFMEPVFTTLPGRLVMTLAIAVLAAAYVISKKIMDIEV